MKYLYILLITILFSDYKVSEYTNIINITVLFGLILISFTNWKKIELYSFQKQTILSKLFIIFLILLFISYLRSNIDSSSVTYSYYKIIIIIIMIFATLSVIFELVKQDDKKNVDDEKLFFFFITIPITFIVSNYIFELLSIDIFDYKKNYPQIGFSEMLRSLFGLEIQRLPLPLTSGVNNYGSFLGASAIISVTFYSTTKIKKFKKYSLIFFILSIFGLLILDMRSSLLAIIFIVICNRFLKDLNHLKITGLFISFISFLPILLVLTSFLVTNSQYLDFLSRNSEDLATGNNRNILWALSLNELISFKMNHLIGFGEFGQVGSKVSSLWAKDFSIFSNSEYVSTHNILLQLILDIGYIGLFVYYTLIIVASRTIRKMYITTKNRNLLVLQNFIFYFAFVGGTESLNYHNATFWMFIFTFVIIIYLNKKMSTNHQLFQTEGIKS